MMVDVSLCFLCCLMSLQNLVRGQFSRHPHLIVALASIRNTYNTLGKYYDKYSDHNKSTCSKPAMLGGLSKKGKSKKLLVCKKQMSTHIQLFVEITKTCK